MLRIPRMGMVSMLLASSLVLVTVGGASAAGNTLRVDPPTTSVAKDATFTVRIVQNGSVVTSAAQVTVKFDKAKLQVTKITRGAPYAASSLFLGADQAGISNANKSGTLKGVAASFFPPGSVPTGDQEFISIEMKAIGCGASKLELPVGPSDAQLLDGREAPYGTPLKVTTTGGSVTVACDGSAASPPPAGSSSAPGAPSPSGEVAGSTGSPDPLLPSADTGEAPLPGDGTPPSLDPGAPAASAGPDLAPVGSATDLDTDSPWLAFALAALAVAAAALALLILVVVIVAIVAGAIALSWLIRTTRTPASPPEPATPGGPGPIGPVPADPDEEEEYDPLAATHADPASPPSERGPDDDRRG